MMWQSNVDCMGYLSHKEQPPPRTLQAYLWPYRATSLIRKRTPPGTPVAVQKDDRLPAGKPEEIHPIEKVFSSDTMYFLMSLGSQLPHKNVNSMFSLVIVKCKLTILWGSRLSKTD